MDDNKYNQENLNFCHTFKVKETATLSLLTFTVIIICLSLVNFASFSLDDKKIFNNFLTTQLFCYGVFLLLLLPFLLYQYHRKVITLALTDKGFCYHYGFSKQFFPMIKYQQISRIILRKSGSKARILKNHPKPSLQDRLFGNCPYLINNNLSYDLDSFYYHVHIYFKPTNSAKEQNIYLYTKHINSAEILLDTLLDKRVLIIT